MKSLRWRLTLWFGLSLLLVVGLLVVSAHWHLDYELRKEKWERSHPAQPDWILHGSFTDKEVHDILGELLQFWLILALPAVGLSFLAAYLLARHSTRPIRQVNEQLTRIGPATLGQTIRAPDADPEIAQLVAHLNGLLSRLETAFRQLQEYASQVAHELRTPLQLMRLQIEGNASKMEPGFAEDLQQELARLSNYVESALTIARADQGRLEPRLEAFAFQAFLGDLVEPFSRLAALEHRRLIWSCPAQAIAWSDRDLLKRILFNLLSNALKHGRGDILLRTVSRRTYLWVLIGNQVALAPGASVPGLGIGLRLVRALSAQLTGVHFEFRKGHTFFWARLRLPTASR